MSYEVPFAYAESPAGTEDERPWLKIRRERERMLGVNPPPVLVPDWPDVLILPGFQLNRVLPTHFRAYTRVERDVMCDAGETFEQSRYNLRCFVEGRNP